MFLLAIEYDLAKYPKKRYIVIFIIQKSHKKRGCKPQHCEKSPRFLQSLKKLGYL